MKWLDVALEVFSALLLAAYYIVESIVRRIVPVSWLAKDISSDVVLITGGGSGLGRLTAVGLARLCAYVVVLDINEEGKYKVYFIQSSVMIACCVMKMLQLLRLERQLHVWAGRSKPSVVQHWHDARVMTNTPELNETVHPHQPADCGAFLPYDTGSRVSVCFLSMPQAHPDILSDESW